MLDTRDDRLLLKTARDLARLPVDSLDARAAVARARGALPSPRRYRRIVVVSGGIAAAVALVAALFMAFVPQRAGAAEQLAAAAGATRSYRGWVHVTATPPPANSPMAAMVKLGGLHLNTGSGAFAIEFQILGKRCVKMVAPGEHREWMYSEATNELHVSTVTDEAATVAMTRMAELPLKLADLLAELRAHGGGEPKVAEFAEQDLQRFELTPPPGADKTSAKVSEAYRELATASTVWVDPQTKLIRRMRTTIEGQPVVADYAYGAPDIRDIYDLGVPRTVTVVDDQEPASATTANVDGKPPAFHLSPMTQLVPDPSVDLDALQARLQAHARNDFGDFVMLQCEEIKSLHPSGHREGRVTLQARDGDKGIYEIWLVAPALSFFGGPGFPRGWPTPKLDDALAVLRRAVAVRVEVVNGHDGWTGQASSLLGMKTRPTTQAAPQGNPLFNFAAFMWPGSVGATGLGTHGADVLRDPARPGLVVLHLQSTLPTTRGNDPKLAYRWDSFYWLDPARDDLPVENFTRMNSPGEEPLGNTIHEIFFDFARLPDGHWYPTRWQQRTSRPPATQPTTVPVLDDGYIDFNRQVFPSAKLDAEWYGDPSRRAIKPMWPAPK